MGSTLFVVESPFQCLCMLEAIAHFQIKEYAVLVIYGNDKDKSRENINSLLNECGILYSEYKMAHIIKDYIPLVLSKKKLFKRCFDNIFVGDFYNPMNEIVGKLFANREYNLYYLDDGVQALSLFSEKPRKRYESLKIHIVLRIYDILMIWKKCLSTSFFTIYNVKSDKVNIIHNDLSWLKKEASKVLKGVYIIGTNSSVVKFKDRNYYDYLNALLCYLKNKWPSESIYYCAHRRDNNNLENKKWCELNNVRYFESNISVEYDFTKSNINPMSIIGFTSNALNTLKALFPDSEVCTVFYHLLNEHSECETEIIRKKMCNSGVKLIKLFDE